MPWTAGQRHLLGDSLRLAVVERRLRFETWAKDEAYMTSSSRLGRIDRLHRHLRCPFHSDVQSDCSRHIRPLPRLLLTSDVNVGHHRWTRYSVLDVCELAYRVNIHDSRRGARKRLGHPGIPDDAGPENARRGLQEEVWDDSVFCDAGEHHWPVSWVLEDKSLPSSKRFGAVFTLERSVVRVCRISTDAEAGTYVFADAFSDTPFASRSER
jgi:hypothetical protein